MDNLKWIWGKEVSDYSTYKTYGNNISDDINNWESVVGRPEEKHIWGEWTFKDKEDDERKCLYCGIKETQPHRFVCSETIIQDNEDKHIIHETYMCIICNVATYNIDSSQEHKYGNWQYIGKNTDAKYCNDCSHIKTRNHQHDNSDEEIKYEYKSSNKDGTHMLEASYTCKSCNNIVIKSKIELCDYNISYLQNKTKGTHIEVKECKVCKHTQEREENCTQDGELKYEYKSSNKDGTHMLEASYTCKSCNNIVIKSKIELCDYNISYLQNKTKGTHIEVKECNVCKYTQEREENCTQDEELKYVYKSSNNDGTHILEGNGICKFCNNDIKISKNEGCVYETEYEKTGVNDIHIVVNKCRVCQYITREEGTCIPTGELKFVKIYAQIYEYYDCKLCADYCKRVYHTVHKFNDWEYRDSQTHIRYCACTEGREIENHLYNYDRELGKIKCEACGDTKTVKDHDHGYDTHDDMNLLDLLKSPAYNELLSFSQIANPNPSPDSYCSRYDFCCKTCGAGYSVYYNHTFVDGVCDRKGYCGGIAQTSEELIETIEEGTQTEAIEEGTQTEEIEESTETEAIEEGTQTETIEEGTQTEEIEESTETEAIEEGTQTEEIEESTQTETIEEGTQTKAA